MTRPSRLSWVLAACMAIAHAPAGLRLPDAHGQDAERVLTIVEPSAQSLLAGVVRMRADVVPAADVRRVEFFVDGAPACTAPAPPPFECAWDAGNEDAPRIVRVVARFASGGRLVRSVRTRGRPATLFTAGTNVILVPVVVQDRRGRFVENLAIEDFALFEDGVRQDATFFEAAGIPLDLVLAIDFSSSMRAASGPLRFAARHFVGELPESARLGLIAFNDRVYRLARQEQDRSVLTQALDALPAPFGGTALLDAMNHALDLHGEGQAHRVVVLFSDGDDQHSFSGVEVVEQRLRAAQATAYTITMGRGREIEGVRKLLGRLTRVSGGRSFSIERIEDLNDVLTHIRDDLLNRYLLAYEPSNRARDGAWRRIEIRTSDRRHVVTAREGYLAERDF